MDTETSDMQWSTLTESDFVANMTAPLPSSTRPPPQSLPEPDAPAAIATLTLAAPTTATSVRLSARCDTTT